MTGSNIEYFGMGMRASAVNWTDATPRSVTRNEQSGVRRSEAQ